MGYKEALEYATKKHDGKLRKGSNKVPYITHPIEVSKLIEKYMKKDEELEKYKIAALLHDTLEDTDATYEEEAKLFGKDVADIVMEVTNDEEKKKKLGKEVYLANKMVLMNDKSLILKLCDRLHNVSCLRYASNEFNEKYIKETNYIINFLLQNRKLNKVQLKQVNDIMIKVKEVSLNDPVLIKSMKKTYHL